MATGSEKIGSFWAGRKGTKLSATTLAAQRAKLRQEVAASDKAAARGEIPF